MRHLIPSLLLPLLLAATACSHADDPAPPPAPTLEGSWNLESTETTEVNGSGATQSQTGVVPYGLPTTYVFTSTSLTIRAVVVWTYTYARNGNVLTLTPTNPGGLTLPFNQTVTKLTATNLDLLDTRPSVNTPSNTALTTLHLVRQ